MNRLTLAVVAVALAVPGACFGQEVLWDYGPQTGPNGGCWQNYAEFQNFAERVTFDRAPLLNGYQHFTCIDGVDGLTFEFKILADENGLPGSEVARIQLRNSGQTQEDGIQRYDFEFDDIELHPGTYWVGLAGVGFEAGQTSISPGPDDTQMAQFQGAGYQSQTGVGDQMFRLLGTSAQTCYPDCNEDQTLDLFDFLCFVNEFNVGGDIADCNEDETLDLFDFLCFVNSFNDGC